MIRFHHFLGTDTSETDLALAAMLEELAQRVRAGEYEEVCFEMSPDAALARGVVKFEITFPPGKAPEAVVP